MNELPCNLMAGVSSGGRDVRGGGCAVMETEKRLELWREAGADLGRASAFL